MYQYVLINFLKKEIDPEIALRCGEVSNGILGIILGILITLVLAVYMAYHPIVTTEWSATMYLTPLDLLINSVILFIAALIAGYVPAYQVSREDIQTAMRA